MPNMNLAYTWAINTCNAPNIGYSQLYRNQRTVNGITYYDCSSFINYAILAGGFSTPKYAPKYNAFTTPTTLESCLSGLGFTIARTTPSFEWLPGDIGYSGTHTEMCYSKGVGSAIFMGAHGSNYSLDKQVSINSGSTSFPYVARYGDGGAIYSGYSKYVVAAMCGNFWVESNVNPGVWENLQPAAWTVQLHGYGLGQWTNYNETYGRLYKLHEWLIDNGYEIDSMEGQLAYIPVEANWHKGTDYQQSISYDSLDDFLNSESEDLNYLTKAWLYCWEGIDNGTLATRQSYARQAYNYIEAHANDTSITEYYHSNNYLTEAQILNNCVMLYRLFGGTGGGGGTDTKAKHKLPIWMMIKYRA